MNPLRSIRFIGIFIGIFLGTAIVGTGAFAQDKADIDRTQIIGNRELPIGLVHRAVEEALAGRPLRPAARQRARRGDGAGRPRRVPQTSQLRRADPKPRAATATTAAPAPTK